MTALEEMRRAVFPGVPTDDLWKIRDNEPAKVKLLDDLHERMRQWDRDNPKPDPQGSECGTPQHPPPASPART